MYDNAANVCNILENLSITLKGPACKLVLQSIFPKPVHISTPEAIFDAPTIGIKILQKEKTPENTVKEIIQDSFPIPSRLKDKYDITKALAALMYFKLRKAIFSNANKFESAHRYGVNPKWLSEIIHGRKYMGGKQRKRSGTKEHPLEIKDE